MIELLCALIGGACGFWVRPYYDWFRQHEERKEEEER